MPIPVIGLHNEDKVFVNGSCVMNEESFMLVGSFVAFFIPLVIMVVSYCLTIQVLQKQACVFLDRKNSSQQPLQPPPLTSEAPPGSATPGTSVPSRRSSLNCLRGASSGLSQNTTPCSDTISIIPSSEAPSQLNSPAAGAGRDASSGAGSYGSGRRGMMQAIKNERRASKVLGIVFFLFLIMWCPFFVTNVLYVLCRHSCNEPLLAELLNVFVWVGYISSGVNPLVYTLFNKTYRNAFSSYLRCQYRASAANGGVLLKPVPLHVVPCPPSHMATPVLVGGKGQVGAAVVDRNSNCKNGDGSALRNLELDDPAEDTEMEIRAGAPGLLSVNSRHAPREDTSTV